MGSLEFIFVSIKIDTSKKMILSCIYFPPNSDFSLYQYCFNIIFNIIENVILLCLNTDLLLFGDFNLPHLNKTTANLNFNC